MGAAEFGDSFLKRRVNPLAHPSLLPLTFSTRFMAHGADMVVESRNMSDDVLFTPELIVLMQPTIC